MRAAFGELPVTLMRMSGASVTTPAETREALPRRAYLALRAASCPDGVPRVHVMARDLVRSLIENDYMNAEVVRFDGGIRFQPK